VVGGAEVRPARVGDQRLEEMATRQDADRQVLDDLRLLLAALLCARADRDRFRGWRPLAQLDT